TASNASERGVDRNGISVGTLASSSSLPKQKTKHEMEKEMTKKLNSAGRDMHELQALLLQESILTGNLLDPCLEPLVSRYSDQIKVADAILKSAAAATSSSSTLNKEKYHYYLEELQDFDWGKSQYDDFMNSTTIEKDHIASEDEWNDENENHVQIVSEALFNADSLNTEDDKVTFLRWNGISQDSDGSGDLKRIEFRETTGSNSLNSVLELERDSCCRVNSTRSIASNASTTKSSCQKNSSSRLKTVKAYSIFTLSTELTNSVACSDENIISDISEDVTDFHRYKVLRRKQKSNSLRPRMQDVFPQDQEEYVPSSTTSSPNQSLDHFTDRSLLNGIII
ncbi:Aspartate--tRNA ligase, partial [Orchesella cincta]